MTRKMLLLELVCPSCEAGLTEGTQVVLDAYVEAIHQDGPIRLSAIFGDASVVTELAIPEGAVAQFRCPRCDASLMLSIPCKLCGAPVASLNLAGGGYLEFCSRRGCKGYALGGLGNVDQMMSLLNRMFETPYD